MSTPSLKFHSMPTVDSVEKFPSASDSTPLKNLLEKVRPLFLFPSAIPMIGSIKNSHARSWYATYSSIINITHVERTPTFAFESEEFTIHCALEGLAAIVCTSWWSAHPPPPSHFPPVLTPLTYLVVLLNILDLPVCFSRQSRVKAIRTIGKLVQLTRDHHNPDLVKH